MCRSALVFQDFSIAKKKKKKRLGILCSKFNTLVWQTYHYSQIGISSLISADLKLKIQVYFLVILLIFFPSCCAIISVVAFLFYFFEE